MRLPKALIIGPKKAGTTWIHEYLSSRGDVGMPDEVKETFFFDRFYDRGVEWYADRFRRAATDAQRTLIEVAPSIFHHPQAPDRVYATLGAIQIVVTIRDPVARSWSHYLHLRRYGYTRDPLQKAVARFPEIIAGSRYPEMIARWRNVFGETRIGVVALEDLRADPHSYVSDLCAALRLPSHPIPPTLLGRSNAGAVPPSFTLARLGRVASHSLRSVGLYGTVNAAKRLGLKRVFFGAANLGSKSPLPNEEEAAFLRERLKNCESYRSAIRDATATPRADGHISE